MLTIRKMTEKELEAYFSEFSGEPKSSVIFWVEFEGLKLTAETVDDLINMLEEDGFEGEIIVEGEDNARP